MEGFTGFNGALQYFHKLDIVCSTLFHFVLMVYIESVANSIRIERENTFEAFFDCSQCERIPSRPTTTRRRRSR